MKVLWFEVTTPGRYKADGAVLGGWQDSLERIVRTVPEIELVIAFENESNQGIREIDGVKYIPIKLEYSEREKKQAMKTWEVNANKIIPAMAKIVKEVNPDLIHVFGTEWPFGLIAEYTDIPVVIHIQGSIAPFNNALYPPRYSFFDVMRNVGWRHLRKLKEVWTNYQKDISREKVEERVWKTVKNYMGRTEWDEGLSAVMHPGRRYFHVEEALRPYFTSGKHTWHGYKEGKIKLLSTGCISFRKGPDMMLKTAHILKSLGVDFEWDVAGFIPWDMRQIVERKEGISFDDCNIKFHGFVSGDKVLEMLCETTLFVHTAYAENSPNSICEAQCLGVPVVATNVGGVFTLIRDRIDGVLVPANDPWMMAHHISLLLSNEIRLQRYSKESRKKAMERHKDDNIKRQLLDCYKTLIYEKSGY